MVVGGGVMGCACAWELARAGHRVVVLERSVPGAEASSAAAGILGAQLEAQRDGPMLRLCVASRTLWPKWARTLTRATGIDVEHRSCGAMEVATTRAARRHLAARARWQRKLGLDARSISAERARAVEPALGPCTGALLLADDARVDPPRLLRALHVAALRAGVEFRTGAYVRRVVVTDGAARGVELEGGQAVTARQVVVAAGSWTTLVGGLTLAKDAVTPARGQIVELVSPAPVVSRVVAGSGCYLVPRDDGRTLVGSTLEFVGFERDVTARAVRDLLTAAVEMVPALADASVSRTWSSFRPYTVDELPLIGPTDVPGLTLATGHYRNGILLAPVTARIVSAVVRGRTPPADLEAFSTLRASAARRKD